MIEPRRRSIVETCDVAIIGAGPYGLSAAAHLRPLKGLDTLVFGEPMSFWERSMPAGMRLLSPSATCHIADPANRLNLDIYRELNTRNSENHDLQDHLQVADFIKYGHWFHQEAGVRADRRKVVRVDLASKGYQVTLEDGETLRAGRVVVAGGIQPFVHRPKVFEGLPSSLVAHTSEQYEYGKFRDKEVLVIGGGRSSIEAAVFLREAGAHVEVLIRNAGIGSPNPTLDWLKSRSWISIFYGKGGVGPPGISHIVQRPNLYRRLPRSTQDSWDKRATRTKFIYHHLPGPHNISVHRGRSIVQARIEGDVPDRVR